MSFRLLLRLCVFLLERLVVRFELVSYETILTVIRLQLVGAFKLIYFGNLHGVFSLV